MDITPFSQQLNFLNRGSIDVELTEELAKVVQAVRETGRSGSITLTISVQMLNKRNEDTMRLIPDIKSKLPKLERGETIMFSTADGDLLREDPVQMAMQLEVVEKKQQQPIKLGEQA